MWQHSAVAVCCRQSTEKDVKSPEIEQVEGHAVPLAAVLCVFKQKLWTLFDRFLILKPNRAVRFFFTSLKGSDLLKTRVVHMPAVRNF